MKQNTLQGASFFLGVFLVTGGTLALQIVQTRILSVMTWYYTPTPQRPEKSSGNPAVDRFFSGA